VAELHQPVGVAQEQHRRQRQPEGQPEALLHRGADLVAAPGAHVVGHRRRHRLQDADHQHDHRDVDAAGHRDGSQVFGAIAPGEHGVAEHLGHRRKLGDQYGPGQLDDATGEGGGFGAHGLISLARRDGSPRAMGGQAK
jgi:hypothetical protein